MKRTIGELKELTNRLTNLEDVQSKALDVACVGMWLWNPQTDDTTFDKRMLRIFDITEEEFSSNLDFLPKIIHPEDKSRIYEAMAKSKDNGVKFDEKYRVFKKDGSIVNIHGKGELISDPNTNDKVFSGVCWIID